MPREEKSATEEIDVQIELSTAGFASSAVTPVPPESDRIAPAQSSAGGTPPHGRMLSCHQ
jgi:hypothetical protein